MQKYLKLLTDGTLVKTTQGKYGIVVAHDYRRDHDYLERDLWVLVLVDEKNIWVRAADLYGRDDSARHL
jgi:hypothetical protein